MNKLKKILIIFSIIIAVLYGLFFAIVYAFGNLNKYLPEIQKLTLENVGLDINAKSIKLTPTPKVEIKITVDEFNLKYPESKEIAAISNLSVKIPILPIILGNIKLSEIKINSPQANFELNKKGEIDFLNYLTPYLEKMNNQQISQDEEKQQGLPKYFRISTKMPDIKITKYNISLFDETINQKVFLNGDKLDIINFDLAKGLEVITKGQLATDKQKFINYDIDIETFIPKTEETTQEQKIQSAFIDPFKSMINYNFYSDIYAKLKITENKTDGVNIKGDLNLRELNLKYNSTNTKGTFANLKFDKNTIIAVSNLFLTQRQKASINADIKYGKKNNIKVDVFSDKLDLIHFVEIAQAIFDTLGIPNDFNLIKVNGYISPNFSINSDLKTLQSKGHIYIKEGIISHKSFPARISDITSDIDLNGNKITIEDTKALVNNQPVKMEGTITQKADCDIKINAQNLSLSSLFEIFADKSLKNTYKISSGQLGFDILAKGKLDKIMPKANVKIDNLNLKDKINHYTLLAPAINLDVKTDLKTYDGNITLGTTKINLSDLNLSAYIKNLKLNFDDKDLTINPFDIDIQNSIFKTQGIVKDYASKMNFEITTTGNLATNTIKSFIPKELKSMITNKGALPVNATITGDAYTLGVAANIAANSSNYFTPIHITQLSGKPTLLKIDIKTKGNDLHLNNITLDTQTTHFADIKGVIASYAGKNPVFKNLKINTPTNFSFSIPDMPNSIVTLNSNLSVSGTMSSPKVLGNINISKLSVPTFKLQGNNISINLTNSLIKASSDNINIGDSDIKFSMNANNNLTAKIFKINNMTVNSNNLNLGKILDILANMPQNSNAPGTDFPLEIKSGHGTIKNFRLDPLTTRNSSADFNLIKNTIYLNNLKTTAYSGNVEGNLSYNLQYLRMKAKLKGQNLNANSAVTTFLGLKDQMKGNLNFNADLTMTGATEKQQMQSLKGSASFVILDGQMGSLGAFEHFLYAQNLISQSFVKTTLGSVVSKLAPKNTGKFAKMSGDIGLSNGWAQIVQISSSGPNMSLFLTGKYNLLTNYANIDILGNISQEVANSLGPVGELSLEKLTSKIPKIGMTVSKIASTYNLAASDANMNKIPKLSTGVNEGTKSFKVKIDGNIESASAVKSFMWLMSEAQANAKKKELIENSTILNKAPNLKQKMLDSINSATQNNTTQKETTTGSQTIKSTTTIPKTKEEIKSEVKEQLKQTGTNILKDQINKKLPGFLDNIGTQQEEAKE